MLSGLVLVWLLLVKLSQHRDVRCTFWMWGPSVLKPLLKACYWNPNQSTLIASFLKVHGKYYQFILFLTREDQFPTLERNDSMLIFKAGFKKLDSINNNKGVSHFLWAPCSFIVFNLNLKFYIPFGGNYKPLYIQTPQWVGAARPQPLRCIARVSAIIIFLSYFEMVLFCVHFGYSIGGRIYYNMDHLSSVFIYLLLDLNHSRLSPSTSLCL